MITMIEDALVFIIKISVIVGISGSDNYKYSSAFNFFHHFHFTLYTLHFTFLSIFPLTFSTIYCIVRIELLQYVIDLREKDE